jgi:cytoskeletal protein RodZ
MKRLAFTRILSIALILFWIFPQIALAGADDNPVDGSSNSVNNSESTSAKNTPTNSETVLTSTTPTTPTNSETASTSTTTTTNSEIATTSTSNYVPQQTGIVQFNNSSQSTLTYPNCGGICAFGIVRLTPNNTGNMNPEAVMGVVMQFDSPENRYARAQRDLSKAQSDRIAQEGQLAILTKLADAVENCQDSRANLLALSAAKSLGMTPEELLSHAYKQSRSCSSR